MTTFPDPAQAPTGRERTRRPPLPEKQNPESTPPAHNFADRRRLDAADRRKHEGRELMDAVLHGTSTAELSRQKRFCYRTVRRMLAAFSQHAPEEHREMVAGVRGLLQELAFDDLLHWRAESRNPRNRRAITTGKSVEATDLDYLRTASHAYHEACRMLIKLYGLASSGSMPRHGSQSRPPTTEELRERLRQNPEMAAAVAKLLEGVVPDQTRPSAAE